MFGQSLDEWPVPAGGLADGRPRPAWSTGRSSCRRVEDGLGLAAFTIAAAPPTRSSAETPAVRTARRMPLGRVAGAAGAAGVGWRRRRGRHELAEPGCSGSGS